MCEPTTLILAAGVASAAVGVVGAVQQSNAAKATGIANQQMAEAAARDAKARGEQDAIDTRRNADRVAGAQRAKLAADGVDLGGGTAAALVAQTNFFGAQDVATTRANAGKDAWASRAKGSIMAAEGRNAATQGYMKAAGTLLSGSSQVADKWYSKTEGK